MFSTLKHIVSKISFNGAGPYSPAELRHQQTGSDTIKPQVKKEEPGKRDIFETIPVPKAIAIMAVPTIISQLLDGKEEISLGNLSPTRDLTFVDDTVLGFLAASEAPAAVGEVLNLGTGTEISMGDLALLIGKILGKHFRITSDEQRIRPEKSEVERLLGSNAKIKQLTGWKPAHTLAQGLAKTIAWFKNPTNLNRYKADIYNI